MIMCIYNWYMIYVYIYINGYYVKQYKLNIIYVNHKRWVLALLITCFVCIWAGLLESSGLHIPTHKITLNSSSLVGRRMEPPILKLISFRGKLLEDGEYHPVYLQGGYLYLSQGSSISCLLKWPLSESHKCNLA